MICSERGSAMFYILVAIVLLVALSYAVIQSGRGNVSQISEEKSKLVAGEILEYAGAVSSAVAQLRLRGVKDADLCFDHASWGGANYPNPSCGDDAVKIFHVSGGGVTWRNAPAEAMDDAASPDKLWHIYGGNEVEEVGTTCGADDCADLVLFVDELSSAVCQKLNESLGVTAAGAAPPTDTAISETRFIGAYSYSQTIGDEAGGALLKGKTAGCFQKTSGVAEYMFYKVLVAR